MVAPSNPHTRPAGGGRETTSISSSVDDDFPHTVESSRGWMETARGYARDVDFYRGLVVQIGEMFGREACIADDGSHMGDVLCLKVPDLVRRALAPATEDNPDALAWAVEQWRRQVANRPLVNVHRRSLDDVWRQVIRRFGGDPDVLVGPSHDALLASPSPAPVAEA